MKNLYTLIFLLLAITATVKAQVSEQEFQALKAFYNATGGDNWKNRTGWENINTTATKDDVKTSWNGIMRIEGGHVTQINFYSNNLTGVLPEEIGGLKYLNILAVHNNKLQGPLPESLKTLTELVIVNLSSMSLNSPFPSDFIMSWPNLRDLKIYSCGLTGSIDDIFMHVPNILELNISYNNLIGELPPSINLLDLLDFDCSYNSLSGSLPAFDNTKQIYRLNMRNNQFTGSIPNHYGTFNLQSIYLKSNNLSGTIPDWEFISTISSMSLSENFFSFEGLEPVFSQINKFTTASYSTNKIFPVKEEVLLVEKGTPLTLSAVDLSVYNPGGNNNRYKWFKDNMEVYSGNSPFYTVSSASGVHAGVYRFEVTNTVVTDIILKSENITVSIIGGNEAPTDIMFSNDNVDENYTGLATTLSASDPDAADTHTFSLSTGNGTNDKDNHKFSITGNQLSITSSVNFETTPTLNILITTNDGNGGIFTKAFTITVNNVNEAPVYNGQVTSNSIDENSPNGTTIFTLMA